MTTTAIEPRTVRRILGSLFGAQALYSAGSVGTFALMPIVVAGMGGNPVLVGLPSTMLLLGRALTAYPIGILMDKAGRRVGLTLGYFLGVFGFVTALISISQGWLWPFIGSGLILGMARTAADQSRYVAAEVVAQENRGKAMGTLLFANTVGALIGPLLLGPTTRAATYYGFNPYMGPWLVSGLFGIAAAAAIFFFLFPEPNSLREKPAAKKENEPGTSLSAIFALPRIQLALLALLVSQAVMTLIMVITPLSMNHNHHAVESVSFAVMGHTLGMWGLSNVTGWFIDRLGRVVMVTIGGMLLVTAAAIVPLSPELPVVVTAMFLLGLGWNVAYLSGSSLFADSLGVEGRGRAQGLSEVVSSLASGAGSLGTGLLFAFGDIQLVGGVGVAIASILLLGVLRLMYQERGAAQVRATTST